MKTCNKLVRDNVTGLLKSQGYEEIKGKNLKGKKYKAELYSLFLQEYKESLNDNNNLNQQQLHYVEMLEVVRTLMVASKTNIKDVGGKENPTMQWYKKADPSQQRLKKARLDLLQKFYELLQMKTEAIKDQLGDIFTSFKELIEANNLSFAQVEQARRVMYKKLGGFSKGTYLVSVSKTSTYSV